MNRTMAFGFGMIAGVAAVGGLIYAVFGDDFMHLTQEQWKEIQASGILEHKSELKML